MKVNAIVINEKDSVAVAVEPLFMGMIAAFKVNGKEKNITIIQDIPIYHKFSIVEIKEGEEVHKYGESIGRTISNILPGEHVHTHNLKSVRELIVEESRLKGEFV